MEEDSPNRCQAVNSQGQCNNKKVEGSDFCPAHGGNKALQRDERIRVKGYLLARYQARAADFADDYDLKGLRGEVGILRMILENKLAKCSTDVQLAIQSPALSDLVMKIQKLVTGCHRLEESLGKTMDEQQLMKIADSICGVLSEYITNEDTLKEVAGKLGIVIAEAANNANA